MCMYVSVSVGVAKFYAFFKIKNKKSINLTGGNMALNLTCKSKRFAIAGYSMPSERHANATPEIDEPQSIAVNGM